MSKIQRYAKKVLASTLALTMALSNIPMALAGTLEPINNNVLKSEWQTPSINNDVHMPVGDWAYYPEAHLYIDPDIQGITISGAGYEEDRYVIPVSINQWLEKDRPIYTRLCESGELVLNGSTRQIEATMENPEFIELTPAILDGGSSWEEKDYIFEWLGKEIVIRSVFYKYDVKLTNMSYAFDKCSKAFISAAVDANADNFVASGEIGNRSIEFTVPFIMQSQYPIHFVGNNFESEDVTYSLDYSMFDSDEYYEYESDKLDVGVGIALTPNDLGIDSWREIDSIVFTATCGNKSASITVTPKVEDPEWESDRAAMRVEDGEIIYSCINNDTAGYCIEFPVQEGSAGVLHLIGSDFVNIYNIDTHKKLEDYNLDLDTYGEYRGVLALTDTKLGYNTLAEVTVLPYEGNTPFIKFGEEGYCYTSNYHNIEFTDIYVDDTINYEVCDGYTDNNFKIKLINLSEIVESNFSFQEVLAQPCKDISVGNQGEVECSPLPKELYSTDEAQIPLMVVYIKTVDGKAVYDFDYIRLWQAKDPIEDTPVEFESVDPDVLFYQSERDITIISHSSSNQIRLATSATSIDPISGVSLEEGYLIIDTTLFTEGGIILDTLEYTFKIRSLPDITWEASDSSNIVKSGLNVNLVDVNGNGSVKGKLTFGGCYTVLDEHAEKIYELSIDEQIGFTSIYPIYYFDDLYAGSLNITVVEGAANPVSYISDIEIVNGYAAFEKIGENITVWVRPNDTVANVELLLKSEDTEGLIPWNQIPETISFEGLRGYSNYTGILEIRAELLSESGVILPTDAGYTWALRQMPEPSISDISCVDSLIPTENGYKIVDTNGDGAGEVTFQIVAGNYVAEPIGPDGVAHTVELDADQSSTEVNLYWMDGSLYKTITFELVEEEVDLDITALVSAVASANTKIADSFYSTYGKDALQNLVDEAQAVIDAVSAETPVDKTQDDVNALAESIVEGVNGLLEISTQLNAVSVYRAQFRALEATSYDETVYSEFRDLMNQITADMPSVESIDQANEWVSQLDEKWEALMTTVIRSPVCTDLLTIYNESKDMLNDELENGYGKVYNNQTWIAFSKARFDAYEVLYKVAEGYPNCTFEVTEPVDRVEMGYVMSDSAELPTQEDVDAAYTALQTAKLGLLNVSRAREMLATGTERLIEFRQGNYNEEKVNVYEDALEALAGYIDSTTSSRIIDQAMGDIEAAYQEVLDSLVLVDLTGVINKVSEYSRLREEGKLVYEKNSWSAFVEKFDKAKELVDGVYVTEDQAEVDQILADLVSANGLLVMLDRDELGAKLAESEELYNGQNVDGRYSVEDFNRFKAAYEGAKDKAEAEAASLTQDEVDTALAELTAALEMQEVDTGDKDEAIALLNDAIQRASEVYNAGNEEESWTAESWTDFVAAFEAAQQMTESDMEAVTAEEIRVVAGILSEALSGLVPAEPEVDPEMEVAMDELLALCDRAEQEVVANRDLYTVESYNAFKAIYEYAKAVWVSANQGVTEVSIEEVREEIAKLTAAWDLLVPVEGDEGALTPEEKQPLRDIIDDLENKAIYDGGNEGGEYTLGSYEQFKQAYEAVIAAYENAELTEGEMLSVVSEFSAAKDALEPSIPIGTPVDKEALNEALNLWQSVYARDNIDGKYTEESFNAFKVAYSVAMNVKGSDVALQDEVDAALRNLQAAASGLEEAQQGGNEGGNEGGGDEISGTIEELKTQLQKALDDNKALYEGDNSDDKYTDLSFDTFKQAYANALQVIDKAEVTENELKIAINSIKYAIRGLKVNDGSGSEGSGSGSGSGSGTTVNVVELYKALRMYENLYSGRNSDGKYTEESYANFVKAYDYADKVFGSGIKHQSVVDYVTSELHEAAAALGYTEPEPEVPYDVVITAGNVTVQRNDFLGEGVDLAAKEFPVVVNAQFVWDIDTSDFHHRFDPSEHEYSLRVTRSPAFGVSTTVRDVTVKESRGLLEDAEQIVYDVEWKFENPADFASDLKLVVDGRTVSVEKAIVGVRGLNDGIIQEPDDGSSDDQQKPDDGSSDDQQKPDDGSDEGQDKPDDGSDEGQDKPADKYKGVWTLRELGAPIDEMSKGEVLELELNERNKISSNVLNTLKGQNKTLAFMGEGEFDYVYTINGKDIRSVKQSEEIYSLEIGFDDEGYFHRDLEDLLEKDALVAMFDYDSMRFSADIAIDTRFNNDLVNLYQIVDEDEEQFEWLGKIRATNKGIVEFDTDEFGDVLITTTDLPREYVINFADQDGYGKEDQSESNVGNSGVGDVVNSDGFFDLIGRLFDSILTTSDGDVELKPGQRPEDIISQIEAALKGTSVQTPADGNSNTQTGGESGVGNNGPVSAEGSEGGSEGGSEEVVEPSAPTKPGRPQENANTGGIATSLLENRVEAQSSFSTGKVVVAVASVVLLAAAVAGGYVFIRRRDEE